MNYGTINLTHLRKIAEEVKDVVEQACLAELDSLPKAAETLQRAEAQCRALLEQIQDSRQQIAAVLVPNGE